MLKNLFQKIFNNNISVSLLQVGLACVYTHCFLNIDRKKMMKKIQNSSLRLLRDRIRILKPEAYFTPAPGAIISGKYSKLNDLVSRLKTSEVKNFLKKENTIFLDICGGGSALKYKDNWIVDKAKYNFNQKQIIRKLSKTKYSYSIKSNKVNIEILDKVFLKALNNYFNRLTKYKIKSSWKINFLVYQNLQLNSANKIDLKKSIFFKKYKIDYSGLGVNSTKNFTKLQCNLDLSLFYALLNKKKEANWNHALSGSLILYKRFPDKFDPNLLFSINF